MRRLFYAAIAAAALTCCATAASAADTIQYNSAPADGWFYGTGNNYTPANTATLTTDDGWQLALRAHQTFENAPASTGSGVYNFALGTTPISFDWGLDSRTGTYFGLPSITLLDMGTGLFTNYAGLLFTPDNAQGNGSIQNSARLNWFLPYDPNKNDTYKITMDAMSAPGMNHSLSIFAKIGDGVQSAVPEPATWAMMLIGFGAIGFSMRRKRSQGQRLRIAQA